METTDAEVLGGMVQLDQVLKPKLASSGLQQYVEVTASISGETERRLLPVYNP